MTALEAPETPETPGPLVVALAEVFAAQQYSKLLKAREICDLKAIETMLEFALDDCRTERAAHYCQALMQRVRLQRSRL